MEQKNSTLVRAHLGCERLDSVAQTLALNALYDKMWLYYNFFQPVMHLSEKEMVSESGTCRVRRRFDKPQTPFERLCAIGVLPEEQREELDCLWQQTNPRRLWEVYNLLDYLFSLPGATPGLTENVLETLTMSIPAQKGEGSPVMLSFDRTIASR